MIKVIEHGNKKTAKCYNCGCKFSFETGDVRTVQTHIQEWIKFINCPECGEENRVDN